MCSWYKYIHQAGVCHQLQLLGFKSNDMKVNCWGPKSRPRSGVALSQQAWSGTSSSHQFVTMLSDPADKCMIIHFVFPLKIYIDYCVIKLFEWLIHTSSAWTVVTHLIRLNPFITCWKVSSPQPSRPRTQGVSRVLEVDSKPWLASTLSFSASGWQQPWGVAQTPR